MFLFFLKKLVFVSSGPDGKPLPRDVLQCVSIFDSPPTKGTIDVWWLYDDGGFSTNF